MISAAGGTATGSVTKNNTDSSTAGVHCVVIIPEVVPLGFIV
jgi:hypothetical protein